MTKPRIRPTRAAFTAAVCLLPRHCHSAARSTRPPSSGAAGIKLKTPSVALATAKYINTPKGSPALPNHAIPPAARPKTTAKAKLVSGPTIAMRKSAPGVRASPLSWATPPRSHSTMLSTSMPFRRATSECASSCANSDPMNSSAAIIAAMT